MDKYKKDDIMSYIDDGDKIYDDLKAIRCYLGAFVRLEANKYRFNKDYE